MGTKRIYFVRKPLMDVPSFKSGSWINLSKNNMKLLGILFEENMGWITHIDGTMSRANLLILRE